VKSWVLAWEPQLWGIAEQHYGKAMPGVLDDIFAGFPPLDDDRHYVYRFVPQGPMIDQLRQVYTTGSKEPVVLREKRPVQADLMGFPERKLGLILLDEHREWLFRSLLTRLPPELLPIDLVEHRLELDLGL